MPPAVSFPPRWGFFLALNALSLGVAVVLYQLVYSADYLDGATTAAARWFFDHPAFAVLAATAPMAVTLLIGMHYVRRSLRRRRESRALASRLLGEPRDARTASERTEDGLKRDAP